jgi:phosphate transport system substrate-binding protein
MAANDRIRTPMPGGPRAPVAHWLLAVGVLALGLLGLGAAVASQLGGARPPFLDSAPAQAAPARAGLLLAGSGSNLPLMRRLAGELQRLRPGLAIEVAPSIGSTGAVRAVADGAIDLGLISRPLRPDELRLGLRVLPHARVPVVLAAHPEVGAQGFAREELVALYAGQRPRWPDGNPLHVLQREQGDSSHAAVAAVLPGFAAANERAYRDRLWPVVYNDEALLTALAATPGGVGLTDLGSLALQGIPLRRLAIDGVAPSAEALRAGDYPFWKELAFVVRPDARPEVAEFLRFAWGPEARALLQAAGYSLLQGGVE